jgi:hypothetical protein
MLHPLVIYQGFYSISSFSTYGKILKETNITVGVWTSGPNPNK